MEDEQGGWLRLDRDAFSVEVGLGRVYNPRTISWRNTGSGKSRRRLARRSGAGGWKQAGRSRGETDGKLL